MNKVSDKTREDGAKIRKMRDVSNLEDLRHSKPLQQRCEPRGQGGPPLREMKTHPHFHSDPLFGICSIEKWDKTRSVLKMLRVSLFTDPRLRIIVHFELKKHYEILRFFPN